MRRQSLIFGQYRRYLKRNWKRSLRMSGMLELKRIKNSSTLNGRLFWVLFIAFQIALASFKTVCGKVYLFMMWWYVVYLTKMISGFLDFIASISFTVNSSNLRLDVLKLQIWSKYWTSRLEDENLKSDFLSKFLTEMTCC